MEGLHRDAVMEALGGIESGRGLRTIDAGDWAAFPRRRHFFSTLPVTYNPPMPPRREAPWETGWVPHPQGEMAPMMRSRAEGRVRASTMQYRLSGLHEETQPSRGICQAQSRSEPNIGGLSAVGTMSDTGASRPNRDRREGGGEDTHSGGNRAFAMAAEDGRGGR